MTGQLYPTPDRLGPGHRFDRTPCANEDCRVCRPRASSQAGLATLRGNNDVTVTQAIQAVDATAKAFAAATATREDWHHAETAPAGSILRTADGAVYRRLNNGHWALLGPVAYRPDTPNGHLIHRAQEQS